MRTNTIVAVALIAASLLLGAHSLGLGVGEPVAIPAALAVCVLSGWLWRSAS